MQEEEWDNKDRAEEITDGIMYEESETTRSITAAQVKEGSPDDDFGKSSTIFTAYHINNTVVIDCISQIQTTIEAQY